VSKTGLLAPVSLIYTTLNMRHFETQCKYRNVNVQIVLMRLTFVRLDVTGLMLLTSLFSNMIFYTQHGTKKYKQWKILNVNYQ